MCNPPAVDLDVYAFLTTLPNALVATVNHERMPVLLTGGRVRSVAQRVAAGGLPARREL
jgi:hypothetical protein